MGMARNSGAGNMFSRWASRKVEARRAAKTKGVPVPGTGVRHQHKNKSGSNKAGALNRGNLEWSAKGRKEEDRLRGINNRARDQHVAEGLEEVYEDMFDLYRSEPYRPEEGWENYLPFGVTLNGHSPDEEEEEEYFGHWESRPDFERRLFLIRQWAEADRDLPVCKRILAILDGDED